MSKTRSPPPPSKTPPVSTGEHSLKNGTISNDNPAIPKPPIVVNDTNEAEAEHTSLPVTPLPLHHNRKQIVSLSKFFGRHRRRWSRRGHRHDRRSLRSHSVPSFSVGHESSSSFLQQHSLLNVNAATVEELMTLRGVGRQLAVNIINHRALINGFRKIEDLALVSGMGASKLELIRSEVCVNKQSSGSDSPSMKSASAGSFEESVITTVTNNGQHSMLSPTIKLNINKCSIFELMQIPGVNQSLAARIVAYRDKKGGFKSVHELKNVVGTKRLLSNGVLHGWLATTAVDESRSNSSMGMVNGNNNECGNPPSTPPPPSPSPELAMPPMPRSINEFPKTVLVGEIETDIMADIFELMSLKSPRPFIREPFHGVWNGNRAYRIGIWDMEQLTVDKAKNPGVLEVVGRTILENGLSVLVMQNVVVAGTSTSPLKIFCDELNHPHLQRIREFRKENVSGNWLCCTDESGHTGVLFNEETFEKITPLNIGSYNVKTKFGHNYVLSVTSNNDASPSNFDEKDALIISPTTDTEHSPTWTVENLDPSRNVAIYANGMSKYSTGSHGAITEGLSHLAIPKNVWSWGGRATNSEPLWLTIYEEPQPVPVSERNGEIKINENSN